MNSYIFNSYYMQLTKEHFEKYLKGLLRKELKNVVTKKDLDRKLEGFATKDDIKNFATKDDLKAFATKEDLKAFEDRIDNKFATKEDLLSLEQRMDTKFATKDDLETKLAAQTQELKTFAIEQTEELARIVASGLEGERVYMDGRFSEVLQNIDVPTRTRPWQPKPRGLKAR